MYKGLIRIKCIDLANWAAMNDLLKAEDWPEGVRVSTEGMETLSLYPEASETLEGLQANMAKALEFGIEQYGAHDPDMTTAMKMIKNDMIDGLMTKSYQIQFKYPNAPYIDVIMKDMSSDQPQY